MAYIIGNIITFNCLKDEFQFILLDPVMEPIPEGLKILYFVNNLVWTAAKKFGKFGNRKIGAGSDIDPAFYDRIQGRIRDITLNGTGADIGSSFFNSFSKFMKTPPFYIFYPYIIGKTIEN